jgi:hypothetical protein
VWLQTLIRFGVKKRYRHPIYGVQWAAGQARHMRYKDSPDEDPKFVNPGSSATEPEFAPAAAPPKRVEGAAQPNDVHHQVMVHGAKKAMAASVPGTEYWLP